MKTANEIRSDFIKFFESKAHTFVPSSPVVPQDDPTLLFTNAGMNQFKSIFLGENRENLTRAANSQKCMRVSGKHNDLEEVGRDHHHHTFFEMLGNWSFGDYYKKEAIAWAWELLTEVWKLDKSRLFVTVHHSDDDAEEYWKSETDIEPWRIMRFGDKDNFWEMGETGPCGPCSEIHYDTGDESDRKETHNDPIKGVNGKNDRYREIWNLVFMEFNRQSDKTLIDLPSKNVDTGMGFERIVSILQNTRSNYATDVFKPIISKTENLSGKPYDEGLNGMPHRVIADHIRALVFAVTDGAFPSNEGRGYVLRRLLRRAYRYGRELGFSGPFLYELVDVVVQTMGTAFPEIEERREHVKSVVEAEERRFGQTLEQGMERFAEMLEKTKSEKKTILAGQDVFTLYDTYGFPMDLTRLMAEEQGYGVDESGFEKHMAEQKSRAREAAKKADDSGLSADGWVETTKVPATEFMGYEYDETTSSTARYKITSKGDKPNTFTEGFVVLDKTPFYAESGGQVGDTGDLVTADGTTLRVVNTIKWNDIVVHKVTSRTPVSVEKLKEPVTARIDSHLRRHTRRNHSATHLLQAALRSVLGEHVNQSGSKVDPTELRFDFTHHQSLSDEELKKIERMVNEWILEDLPVQTSLEKTEEARAEGATALFGEKYGETVRVVAMGQVSKELCGGTHVQSTGNIGSFHITAESSISAGVRRVTAVTGLNTIELLARKERILNELSRNLKVSESEILDRVSAMSDKQKELESKVAGLSQAHAGNQVEALFEEARSRKGSFPWVVKNLGEVDKQTFSEMVNAASDAIKGGGPNSMVVVLGGVSSGSVLIAASAGKSAVNNNDIHCGDLVKSAAAIAGGGGGGSPVRAQAGGKKPEKLAEALAAVEKILTEKASVA